MTSSQATAIVKPSAAREACSAALVSAWERRKTWSKTDSARFISERSEPLLALFRREHAEIRLLHTSRFGYWLREHAPAIFARAHSRLAAAPNDEARNRLLPTEIL